MSGQWPPGPPYPPQGPPPGVPWGAPPPGYPPQLQHQPPMPWAVAPPSDPRRAAHPHAEPRTYDEVLRTWDWAWWKALVGFVVLLLGVIIVAPIVLMPVLGIAVYLQRPDDFLQGFLDAATLERVTPASMLYVNLTLASAILVSWFVVRYVHNLRPRWLTSVRPGIRWRFLFVCLGIALIAMAAQLIAGALVPEQPADVGGELNELTGTLVALGLVVLLTTPLQAMGEEYAFRGYLQQAVGSLAGSAADRQGVRRRAASFVVHGLAILIPSLLFALAHGGQNAPLFLDRLFFGLVAAYLVLRTGGLEAGIALHVLNNIVAFGLALAFSDIDSALTITEVSWWQVPLSLSQNTVFLVLVLFAARRMGMQTRTSPPVLVSPDAPV